MGKHRTPDGCPLALARGLVAFVLAVVTLAGCGPTGAVDDRTPGIHEGDGCMNLGREALDAYGKAVVCLRATGSESATWQRR